MSANVKLIAISQQHSDRIQSLVTSHPDISALTNLPEPYPDDGAEQWIKEAVPKHKSGKEYTFAIQNEYSQIVGVCGLIVQEEKNEAELGYWIGYQYWNRGYATAAVGKAINFAFEENFNRVFARPLTRNKASIRVLQKNGFERIETRRNPFDKWKENDLVAIYEITDLEWQKVQ